MSEMAPASFFPTPLEIAGGIRWMRAHPVVATAAAAAATAVSVLTFLKTRAEESEDELLFAAPGATVASAFEDQEDESESEGLTALPRRNRVRRRPASVALVLDRAAASCHARKLSEDVCSSTDSDASSSPTRGRQSSFGELDVEEHHQTLQPAALDERAADREDSSASPQWGWYVSTTPPEDYYQ